MRGKRADSTPPKGSKASTKSKPATNGATATNGHAAPAKPAGLTEDEKRTLFLDHKNKLAVLYAKQKTATADVRNQLKKAKADGFSKDMIDIALKLETDQGEAVIRMKVTETLQAARYVGSDIGNQLDLFAQPDMTPSVDRAYDEGKQASMENRKAAPSYHPSTEQYRRYMQGFHDHQATILKGVKAPEVTSGQKVTRAEFKRQQEAAKAAEQAATTPH